MVNNIMDASTIEVRCAYTKLVDITELVPHPRNPNKHPDNQIAMLAKIIRHQGWRSPVVVSKRSGFVIAGHGRLQAAGLLQVEKVPVDFQDFTTEADEWAHLIADNKIAELADTNYEELSGLLHELHHSGTDLLLSGIMEHDLETLMAAEWKPDNVSQFDKQDQTKMKTICCTYEQHGVFMRACNKLRTDEADNATSEGRCLELICANFIA